MKTRILFICVFLLTVLSTRSQHMSSYVQYMFNGLILNPAYAGSQDALDMNCLYRKQWIGINGAPSEALFSTHSPLKNKNISLGGNFQDSQYGIYNQTRVNLIYAYRFKFLTGKLALGLQAGIDSYTTNWNKINMTDQGDPNFSPSATRKTTPEVGAGMYYHTEKFYLGLSAPSLYNGQLNTYAMKCLSIGAVFDLGENFKMKPALLVRYVTNSPVAANISTTFYFKNIIGIGAGYTYNTSALAYTDIKVNEQLRVGYGYEYSLNALQTYISGSHEIMIRYLFRYKINGTNPRYF